MLAVSIPFGEAEFQAGLERGVVLAMPVLALCGLWWWRFRRPAPVAGLLVALAALWGWEAAIEVDVGPRFDLDVYADVQNGVAVLAAAGLLGDLLRNRWPIAIAPAAVGAWMVANSVGGVDEGWIKATVALTALAGGGLMAEFDRRWSRKGYGPPLLLVSLVGVYFTVPDTEHVLVLLGAAVPAAALAWPLTLARLGVGGSFATAGVLAWGVAADGFGRETAIIGGAACLGLLAAEPLGRAIAGGRSVLAGRTSAVLVPLAGAHLAVVFVASRVAGVRAELSQAAVIAAIALTGAVAIVAATGRVAGRRRMTDADDGAETGSGRRS